MSEDVRGDASNDEGGEGEGEGETKEVRNSEPLEQYRTQRHWREEREEKVSGKKGGGGKKRRQGEGNENERTHSTTS